MTTDWISEIENGSFEADLVRLTLSGKGDKRYEGQGRLEWNHEGVSLFAVTDGGGNTFSQFVASLPGKPGELIPADEFLRLEASTQEGWVIKCERLSNGRFHEVHGQPTLTWEFCSDDFLSELRMTKPASRTLVGSGLECILTNCRLESWTRSSSLVYENVRFGREHHEFDWLEFDCHLGSVAIQKRDNGFAKLRLSLAEGNDAQVPDASSVCSALALLTGRRVEWIAQQVNSSEMHSRRLTTRSGRFCTQRYMAPLANDRRLSDGTEAFLSAATDYFATEEGKRVAGLIDACINSTENSFTTQAMVLCATVESLVKTYQSAIPKSPKNRARNRLLADARKEIAELLVRKGVDESDRRRIDGLFGMLHSTQVKTKLYELSSLHWARIEADEIEAWANLRNQVMHGSLVLADASREKCQVEIFRHQLVANLVNKILLQIIGYSGPFFDYSVWGIADFRPAEFFDGPSVDESTA